MLPRMSYLQLSRSSMSCAAASSRPPVSDEGGWKVGEGRLLAMGLALFPCTDMAATAFRIRTQAPDWHASNAHALHCIRRTVSGCQLKDSYDAAVHLNRLG